MIKRISCFLSHSADGSQDLLGKSDHKPAEKTQEALGSLAGVMALYGHTHLHNAPAQDNHAYCFDCRKDKVREVINDCKGVFRCKSGRS